MTGSKHSDLNQSWGFKFPSTTMRYFIFTGLPSSFFFMIEIVLVGKIVITISRKVLYSTSVIHFQVFDEVCRS